MWATVKDTWTNPWIHHTTQEEKADTNNNVVNGPYPEKDESDGFLTEKPKGCRRIALTDFEDGEVKTRPMSWETMTDDEIPTAIDWRNFEGVNYCSWTVNQHVPVYCGSCWAQATTSALADRFNIMLKDSNPTPIALNAQVIVNCRAGGSCNGGNPGGVYKYAF